MPGYCDPPVEHQFKPGQSGNPKGGPRGPRKKKAARTASFLDQYIECKIGGKRFAGRRGEALMRVAARIAIEKKDYLLQQLLFKLKEQLDDAQAHIERERPFHVIHDWPAPPDRVSCIEDAAQVSGFGKKAYLQQKTGRVLLENWVVEEAFVNFGDRRLDGEQQLLVLEAVRFPKNMDWPDWWEPDLQKRGKGWRARQNVESASVPKAPEVIRRSLAVQLAICREQDRLWEERQRQHESRNDSELASLYGFTKRDARW
jgi:hypothetical protein